MKIFLQEFICQSRGRSVVSQNWLWPTAEDKKQVKKINGVKKKIKSILSLSESTPQQLQMLSLQGTVKFTQYHRGKQITQRTARHRVYDYFCIVQFFLPVLFSSFFFFLQAYIRQIYPIRGDRRSAILKKSMKKLKSRKHETSLATGKPRPRPGEGARQ